MEVWRKPSNLVVLALLVGMAGLVWWVTQREGDESAAAGTETPEAAPGRIFPIGDEDLIRELTVIDNVTDRQVTLEREASGDWAVLLPERAPADNFEAQFIASSISGIYAQRMLSPAEQVNINRFGVLDPNYEIVIQLDNGENYRLAVGELLFDDLTYYVLLDGETEVQVVDRTGIDDLLAVIDTPPLQALEATESTE